MVPPKSQANTCACCCQHAPNQAAMIQAQASEAHLQPPGMLRHCHTAQWPRLCAGSYTEEEMQGDKPSHRGCLPGQQLLRRDGLARHTDRSRSRAESPPGTAHWHCDSWGAVSMEMVLRAGLGGGLAPHVQLRSMLCAKLPGWKMRPRSSSVARSMLCRKIWGLLRSASSAGPERGTDLEN